MDQNIQNDNSNKQEQEIDLIELVKRLWQKRKLILYITLGFMIVGLFVALFSPKVYTSKCVFVPQSSKKSSSSTLSSLASMAGINLNDIGGNSESLSPLVYPQVLDNVDFQKEIMYSKIKFDEWDEPITLIDYYTNPDYQKFSLIGTVMKYTIGLPGVIINAIRNSPDTVSIPVLKGESFNYYSKDEFQCSKILKKKVQLNLDEKKGYITLSVEMPEPLAAAQLAQKAFELLQRYITEFKIEKAQANMSFIQGRYDEAKADFENKQLALAQFKDANRVLSTATASTKLEQLNSEYNISYAIYTEISKQLLQAGIQVKEDTPILTAVQPVVVPFKKTKPKRSQILVIWTFLGFVLGCGYVFGADFVNKSFPDFHPFSKKGDKEGTSAS